MLNIAEIPYLNSAPFYWNKEEAPASFRWISVAPKKMGELAKQGKIDAGPISLADSFALEDHFVLLGNLGIAVHSSAKSVLLFSKKPILSLMDCTIGITPDTATSSELLRVILQQKYNIHTHFEIGFNDSQNAWLLIGDEALKAVSKINFRETFSYMFDLGEEWQSWKNLPFVFARWMIRKDTDPALKEELENWLLMNVNKALANPDQVLDWYKRTRGWNYSKAKDYLSAFQYHLGEKEQKAITTFTRYLDQLKSSYLLTPSLPLKIKGE
jgi:chorismate dehydratase